MNLKKYLEDLFIENRRQERIKTLCIMRDNLKILKKKGENMYGKAF